MQIKSIYLSVYRYFGSSCQSKGEKQVKAEFSDSIYCGCTFQKPMCPNGGETRDAVVW